MPPSPVSTARILAILDASKPEVSQREPRGADIAAFHNTDKFSTTTSKKKTHFTMDAFQAKLNALNATFKLKSFKLRKMNDSSLHWKPSVEPDAPSVDSTTTSPVESPEAQPPAIVVRTVDYKTLAACSPMPQGPTDVPEIHNGPQSQNLLGASPQEANRNPPVSEYVEEASYAKSEHTLVAKVANDKASSHAPREYFAHHFDASPEQFAAPEAPTGPGISQFKPRSRLSTAFVEEVPPPQEPKVPLNKRFSQAVSRTTARWAYRRQLRREHREEDRALKAVQKQTKHKIKMEKRKLKLIEKEKQLDRLRSQYNDAVHQKNQQVQKHKQAAYQRKLDAEQAEQRRKLENLEYQMLQVKANRKAAAALKARLSADLKHSSSKKTTLKVSPQTSKLSPKSSVFTCKESVSSSKTSVDGQAARLSQTPPKSSKAQTPAAPHQHLPLMLVNGCINDKIETNPWNHGVGAEVRNMLGKEKPVLNIVSKPKAPQPAPQNPKTRTVTLSATIQKLKSPFLKMASLVVDEAPQKESLKRSPQAEAPKKSPQASAKSTLKPASPKPAPRKKTPFWFTEEYKKKRQEIAKKDKPPRFAPSQAEIDNAILSFHARSRR